jgi:hypothetical protein
MAWIGLTHHKTLAGVLTMLVSCLPVAPLLASDHRESGIEREAQFGFARKPTVTRRADRVTIAFAPKAHCDATVAIEDAQGRILRHLACGVLGKNAPPPFQKDSHRQVVVWDGKDDRGRYVDDKQDVRVRLSLGLRPRLERSLLWEPRRRVAAGRSPGTVVHPSPLMAAAKEGVYVDDGGGTSLDHMYLFDHEGNYVRTIYPFPAGKVRDVQGLIWYKYPQDGLEAPLKPTFLQNTLLTCGSNFYPTYNEKTGQFCTTASKAPDHMGVWGHAAHAIAVHSSAQLGRPGRIALAHRKVNYLGTDGSSGGLNLTGPGVSFKVRWRGSYAGGGKYEAAPRSAAFSPDGRWLYLAGYLWDKGYFDGLHVVVRVRVADGARPEVFAGSMKQNARGTGPGQFHLATSVACDVKGRVYVSDYMNDRVQVFAPSGKHLESIAERKPAHVAVHRATGRIYVFSWQITSVLLKQQSAAQKKTRGKGLKIPARLTVYGPLEKPKQVASYALPFDGYRPGVSTYFAHYEGLQYRVCLDGWTTPPTVWLVPNTPTRPSHMGKSVGWERAAIRLLVPKDGKLVVKRDFGEEVPQWKPAPNWRQRLYVHPQTGRLYVANGGDTFGRLIEIDPETGAVRWVELPLIAEDMAFGRDGRVVLRTHTELVRYEWGHWRQVPFDYREQRTLEQAYREIKLLSVIPLPAIGHFRHGGIGVSPKGHIAVGCLYTYKPPRRGADPSGVADRKGYSPRLYPGRTTLWVYGATYMHVWDRYGKVAHRDAVPGINGAHGVAIDNRDDVYVMVAAARTRDGKRYFNDATCTLMKFRPGRGRILSTRHTPVALTPDTRPNRPPDLAPFPGPAWVEGAEWLYGGVGWSGKKWEGCCCWNARFALDDFGRTFAPEIDRYKVAVLDTNGNLILQVGRYGNVDDGLPQVKEGGPPRPRSIGGDEVSLFHAPYVASHTDRRLFVADPGNGRIVSVRLGYHAEAVVRLADVPDRAAAE